MFRAEILADSVNTEGDRITTFEVEFPQMVLRDLTRHRCFSYSFESTRAVPVEKRIEQAKRDPYVPDFRLRAKGMGGGERPTAKQLEQAQLTWRYSATQSALWAESLLEFGKEHVGRMLEPYTWITGILTGTEFENFFALRCPPPGELPDPRWPAQIELQILAHKMEALYRTNAPELLQDGEWHLPLITQEERETPAVLDYPPFLARASAGRCAAVSYLNHHRDSTLGASVTRWDERLAPSAHWSPGEHPAMANPSDTGSNLHGWTQLRKLYPNEAIRPRDLDG